MHHLVILILYFLAKLCSVVQHLVYFIERSLVNALVGPENHVVGCEAQCHVAEVYLALFRLFIVQNLAHQKLRARWKEDGPVPIFFVLSAVAEVIVDLHAVH